MITVRVNRSTTISDLSWSYRNASCLCIN